MKYDLLHSGGVYTPDNPPGTDQSGTPPCEGEESDTQVHWGREIMQTMVLEMQNKNKNMTHIPLIALGKFVENNFITLDLFLPASAEKGRGVVFTSWQGTKHGSFT